jgi:hypothetical protein
VSSRSLQFVVVERQVHFAGLPELPTWLPAGKANRSRKVESGYFSRT